MCLYVFTHICIYLSVIAIMHNLSWASYQIRKIAVCACAGNAGNVSPHRRFRMKPLVSDPGMHHGTCVTHVPWCMSGSLTCGGGENVPGACAPAILRIWQEAHEMKCQRVLSKNGLFQNDDYDVHKRASNVVVQYSQPSLVRTLLTG